MAVIQNAASINTWHTHTHTHIHTQQRLQNVLYTNSIKLTFL